MNISYSDNIERIKIEFFFLTPRRVILRILVVVNKWSTFLSNWNRFRSIHWKKNYLLHIQLFMNSELLWEGPDKFLYQKGGYSSIIPKSLELISNRHTLLKKCFVLYEYLPKWISLADITLPCNLHWTRWTDST